MSTLELKNDLHKLIDALQDSSLLEDIHQFVSGYIANNQADNWNTLSEVEQESIKRGLAQLDKEEEINYTEIREKYKKWLIK